MKTSPARVALRKVWISRPNPKVLVEDGDPYAATLFARKGQALPAHALEQFNNADDFFSGGEEKPESKKKKKGE